MLYTAKKLGIMVLIVTCSVTLLLASHPLPAWADGTVAETNVTTILAGTSCGSLCGWTDGELGSLQNGSSYTFFGSNSQAGNVSHSTVTSGSVDNPAQMIVQNGVVLGGLDTTTYGYATIGPVYQDSANNIISFVHLERWPGRDATHYGSPGTFWGSLGMAVSKDGGNSWAFCGEIMQHNLAYNTNDAHVTSHGHESSSGAYAIVNDGGTNYFYVYMTDVTSSDSGGIAVGRATVSSVTGAADAGTCSAPTFHKWNNGWDNANPAAWINGTNGIPQGGPFQDILSSSGQFSNYTGEENITHNTSLNQYILADNPNNPLSGSNYGIALRIGSNPLDFSASPEHLVGTIANDNSQYPSFVGLGSNPETTTGQQFYLYYLQWPSSDNPGGTSTNLVRSTITVGATSTGTGSYRASQGFSATQGQNQWQYQYSTNGESSFTNMSWDAADNAWVGPGGISSYCVVWSNDQHPGTDSCDSARVWVAPSAGTVTLGANGPLSLQTACSTNPGVQIRILKTSGGQTTQIWPSGTPPTWYSLAHGTSYSFPSGVQTTVNANDAIEFVVAHLGSDNYCDATTWDQTVSYSYRASQGFSATQGQNQWQYQYSTNGESSFMNMSWDAADNAWVGLGGITSYCVVWSNAQHPGTGSCDSARVWVAPSVGTVTLGANGPLSLQTACSTNPGVQIRILKTSGGQITQIWPSSGWQALAHNAPYTFPSGVQATVNANDTIEFVVAHLGNDNSCDATTWDQTVSYN